MSKYFMSIIVLGAAIITCYSQPSDQRIREIILSKTKDVIPESIELSRTGGTPMKQLGGLVHWKRSVSFIGNTEVGRKKYSVDVHVNHNYEFIKFTWGDVTYLDMPEPDYRAIEKVIRARPEYFVNGFDGKVREIREVSRVRNDPDAVIWTGGGKEVTLKFIVRYVADGRYDYQERWLVEQELSVRFFRESIDSPSFIADRLYIAKRNKRVDKELLEKLSQEEARKVRWDDNTSVIPDIDW